MSKELEAFKRFRDNAKFDNKSKYYLSTQYIDDSDIIETALDRLIELKDFFIEIESGEAVVVSAEKNRAFEIIKECLVSEFKLFEKDGEYFILFYFDELHQLTFKLKSKEEYDLLKEVLLWIMT